MTRSAARGPQKKIPRGLRRSREIARLGNGASNPYKSLRTMLLTGSWSHPVSCYAVYDDFRRIGGFFWLFFFNLGASSSSWTTSIGMLSVEELQSDSDDGCDTAHRSRQATNVFGLVSLSRLSLSFRLSLSLSLSGSLPTGTHPFSLKHNVSEKHGLTGCQRELREGVQVPVTARLGSY